jgi:choice-of-anchor B domain-containing protein
VNPRSTRPPILLVAFAVCSPLLHAQAVGLDGPQAGTDFASDGVNLEAWLPLSLIDNAASGNDCWGYTAPSGREYAILGTSSGTNFIEVSDPANPIVVDFVDGPDSLWRDVKTYQGYAYAVSEAGSGIQVMDLVNIDSGSVTLVNTITGPGSSATHNVAIDTDSGFLYRLGGANHGVRAYDLNGNPASPSFVGEWSARYFHDAQVVTYSSGPNAGKQVLFGASGLNGGFDSTGLTVLDVTNKAAISVLDQAFYPGPGYSHQGWLSPDLQYFYLGDELDENGVTPSTTHMFDVSDPSNVLYVGKFDNGNTAITHNLYTLGNLIFAANYRSGLRVFDATNPTSPFEIGYFDTYPGSDSAEFNGLWSVYPYFPSGTVIGSDLERGLFVWSIGDAPIAIDIPGGVPITIDPDGGAVPVTITETNPGDLLPGSATLQYDIGAGYTAVPMVDNGGGSFTALFPSIPCTTEVSWYLEAQDSAGKTWRNPQGAPINAHKSLAAKGLNVIADHDMESGQGWTGGAAGDTASTGLWVRVDPRGTAAQPEDDHSDPGTQCWVTGQGSVGGSVGENDVDGGKTTLLSATYDLSPYADPMVSYWRWYSNTAGASPNADVFRVGISADGGGNWSTVETVGPTGLETSGGWVQHTFRVADLVTPTSTVKLRFIAEDAGSGSIVEAAVDDLLVFEAICDGGPGSSYCTPAIPNSTGLPAVLNATGSDLVADNDVTLIATSMPANQFGYFLASQTQAFVLNPGGSDGILCLGGQILRYSSQIKNSGPFGDFSLVLDLTQLPPPGGGISPGETWNFSTWFRDNNPGPTSNFTGGYSILFQ